jgi:hypothetical protein
MRIADGTDAEVAEQVVYDDLAQGVAKTERAIQWVTR